MKEFIRFEINHQLRQPMVHIFFLILLTLVLLDRLTSMSFGFDNLTKININAPYVLYSLVATWLVVGLLFGAAFVQDAATRDFSSKFSEILLTTPIKKRDFYFGRYVGAMIMLILPFLACYLGFFLASLVGPSDRVGEITLLPYFYSFFIYLLPGIVVSSTFMFALTILTRKAVYSFIVAIGLFILYGYAQHYSQNLEGGNLALLLDPFGPVSLKVITRYWTIPDYNMIQLPVSKMFLVGRICWLLLSGFVLLAAYSLFHFAQPSQKKKRKINTEESDSLPYKAVAIPQVTLSFEIGSKIKQVLQQSLTEFIFVLKSPPFLIFTAMAIINILTSDRPTGYDISHYPLTYFLVESLFSSLFNFFVFAIIVFYSGVLVWRERDAKMTELFYATPVSSWIPFLAKVLVLAAIIVFVLLLALASSIGIQALNGFFDFRLDIYLKWLFLIVFPRYLLFGVLALFIHTLINNKYLAYGLFILFLFIQNVLPANFGLNHGLYLFGYSLPFTYSDMNGFEPFVAGIFWYTVYWTLFAVLLSVLTVRLWKQGIDISLRTRLTSARQQWKSDRALVIVVSLLFLTTGGYVYYNTAILNKYTTPAARRQKAAAYEIKYKKFETRPQPRILHAELDIDIFPEERKLNVKGQLLLKNKTGDRIDSLHIVCTDYMDFVNIRVENGHKVRDDAELLYQVFELEPGLNAGDSLSLDFESGYSSKGFENRTTHLELIENGTYIHEGILLPAIGYQTARELDDNKYRKSLGLPEKQAMPNRKDEQALMQHDCPGADWMTFDTKISTSADQIAVAPGILTEEYSENNRRNFRYLLKHTPIVNYYPVMSGRYDVKKDKWKHVDIEVYYHNEHAFNIEGMISAVKKSLDYYSENFGPYPYKFARIVEFPRYRGGARAYPGLIPYSESAGFIYNVENRENIDMVFVMTAHEMAHMWWGHQVVGANVIGNRILTETLAQYSELMVLKQEFGEDVVRKFCRFETDNYLSRRSRLEHEPSLMNAEDQDAVIYHKGLLVMNALRFYIGEVALNRALSRFYNQFAYTEPPYPTSEDLYGILVNETPDSLHHVLADMFENNTLYNNRIVEANCAPIDGEKYALTLDIKCAKLSVDSLGLETEVPLNDWIEIGIYSQDQSNEKKCVSLEKYRITSPSVQQKIILEQKPVQVCLDPNYLLIDKSPSDNWRDVLLIED